MQLLLAILLLSITIIVELIENTQVSTYLIRIEGRVTDRLISFDVMIDGHRYLRQRREGYYYLNLSDFYFD